MGGCHADPVRGGNPLFLVFLFMFSPSFSFSSTLPSSSDLFSTVLGVLGWFFSILDLFRICSDVPSSPLVFSTDVDPLLSLVFVGPDLVGKAFVVHKLWCLASCSTVLEDVAPPLVFGLPITKKMGFCPHAIFGCYRKRERAFKEDFCPCSMGFVLFDEAVDVQPCFLFQEERLFSRREI